MELRLYPANLTEAQFTAGNAALCNLPFAIDPLVSQTINGDWALTFEYPVGKENRLALDMLVEADGQLYRIDELGKNSNRDGERLEIHALHLMYDLRDKQIVNIETSETTPGGINQRTALQQVLEGTPFSDGIIDTDILLDYLDILQKDVMWAIKVQILHLWGGELQPDNWVINIRKQMGQDRGVQLRHGKNIKGVRLQESLDGTITRLHILGYQGANIESINDGKDYIDSPNIGLYANIKEGLVTFPDDDLAEDLLSKGLEYLATVDTPRIRLSVDLAAVKTSVQYQHYKALEDVQLGDTVTVYHKRLDINIISRVQKREYNPVTGENKKVELGNDDRSLFAEIASMQQATEIIKMIADRKGHIRGERLRGVIDLLTTRLYASGSYSNAVVNDKAGILFENTNQSSPDYGAMYIGPGIFAIASEKNADNSWDWRTFGTGQGFYGNELVAGSITANKLASDVGEKLVISSNKAIVNIVQDVDSAQDNISALQQTAQGLQTQVSNNKNNISTLTQTANSLTSRISSVENINNNQNTQISQNTNAITLKADKTTTDGLNARLTTAEQKITPTAITQTVRSSAQYMQDLAGKQPVGDYATNADVTSRLTNYSTVEQTASSIVAAVNDIDVGGRNYVLNSDWSQGALVRWSKNANLAGLYFDQNESFKIDNKQAFILACNPNTEGIMSQYIDIKCVEDSSMILSFFLRTNGTNLTRYNSQNPLIASLEGIDNNSTVLFWKGIHFYTEYRTNLQNDFYKFVFPFTCPAGLTQLRLYLRISSNSADYENWAGYQMIQIEKGTKVTPWKPAVEDPSSGLKSSHITIEDDRIDIATGGKLNMQGGSVNLEAGSDMAIKSGANFDLTANDFVLSNNRSDGVTMMSGGNSIANAPYWLTREGELNFSKLSDGATAMLNNMFKVEFYSSSVAPDNSIGINGALYVLHSASVGSTWGDTAASIPSAQGMQTWFGVYRNWNVLESGCRYIGNGKGTASTKNGTYFTFNAPANMSNATFVFVTNKRHPTQSYYLSTGTTTYRLEIRSGSAAGSLVGRKDFSAGTSKTTQTVSVNGNFTKDTTYYCGIFYPESTELTNCTIEGGITLKGSSSSKEFGLYVKSNGSWKELI